MFVRRIVCPYFLSKVRNYVIIYWFFVLLLFTKNII